MRHRQFVVVIPGGKRYVLRDDGYRIYARDWSSDDTVLAEVCVFEYKHSEHPDAHKIVAEMLKTLSLNGENGAG